LRQGVAGENLRRLIGDGNLGYGGEPRLALLFFAGLKRWSALGFFGSEHKCPLIARLLFLIKTLTVSVLFSLNSTAFGLSVGKSARFNLGLNALFFYASF
jgi:hypothetical protein